MTFTKENISIFFFFIFHCIGAIGLSTTYKDVFLMLTPLHLLLSFVVLVWANRDYSHTFFKVLLVIYSFGYLIEVAGVQTGLLFGEYYYGPVLGFKCFDTPIMIGVNWVILCLSSYGVISFFKVKPLAKIILASVLMVGLDFIIEPVAIQLNFWWWADSLIPTQNYVMWFLVAFLMNGFVHINKLKVNFKVAFGLFISQILFFTILSLVI
ncbi:MAG: carotenoid biosynthesis protein [Flavobacteriales bacterium]